MQEFREFLLSFRLQHFAVGLPINLLINSLAMWFVVNRLQSTGEKVSLWRCGLCALLLYIVSTAAIASLVLPFPAIFFIAGFSVLLLSMLIINSCFELTYQGGGGILFLYLMLLLFIHSIVRATLG